MGKMVTLPLAGDATAVMGIWLVKEGDVVTDGKSLARYTSNGGSHQLGQEETGLVGRILIQQGQPVRAGQPVCSIEPCPHHEYFNGICTACGQFGGEEEEGEGDDAKAFGFFGGVACPRLRRSHEGVESQQQQRVGELVAAKKLALVLDLDHTLLHTAFPPNESQRQVSDHSCLSTMFVET